MMRQTIFFLVVFVLKVPSVFSQEISLIPTPQLMESGDRYFAAFGPNGTREEYLRSEFAKQGNPVLYDRIFNSPAGNPDLIVTGATDGFSAHGLRLPAGTSARLNRYYALGERLIRYRIRLSDNSKAVFHNDKGQFRAYVDAKEKKLRIGDLPFAETDIAFFDERHEYLVEIYNAYQEAKVRLIDLYTGDTAEIAATTNGAGGYGAGEVGEALLVGRQHDYYCFGLTSGTELLVKQITVMSKKTGLTLLIYGDSITEPEGYFPTAHFPQAWTQLIIHGIPGKAMSSGRGGTTINEVLERIKNELPYVQAKYVMVTIGTNGGNTEANLSELVEYIRLQGSIPILNNIPANESGTQVPVNAMIEKVRQKYGIKGCRFDWATSINYEGLEVDKSTMYHEDYDWGQIYHHPNVKGSRLMYLRTLIDVPEIYE